MYYLDSNICIDLMRGRLPSAYQLMRASSPKLFALPAVVEAELRTGAEKSNRPQENRLLLERFLSPYETIPFDSRCAIAYGAIRTRLERRGLTIGPNDLLIAATALANGAILATNNAREFERVEGLMVESWAEVELED